MPEKYHGGLYTFQMAEGSEGRAASWSPLGCGCGAAMAVVLTVVVGLAWFGYSRSERFERELADPEARADRSRAILGYRTLPEGYHPLGGFSIPFIQKMAMLSDREPAPGVKITGPADAFGRRGFVYLNAMGSEKRSRELDAYFDGEAEESEFFADIDQRFSAVGELARGTVRAGGAEVRYVAERGRMEIGDDAFPAVLARLLMTCSDSSRLRVGTWFEPAPPTDDAEALAGTPADSAALRRFLDHFRLCD
jgi:hypothetical protein